MGKRRKFTNEFKLEAVRLEERGDVPVAQLARNLDLHEAVDAAVWEVYVVSKCDTQNKLQFGLMEGRPCS